MSLATTQAARLGVEAALLSDRAGAADLRGILDGAGVLERELGDTHVPIVPCYLDNELDLPRALSAHGLQQPMAAAAMVRQVAGELGRAAPGLDVLLLRALQPRVSLRTWPLDAFGLSRRLIPDARSRPLMPAVPVDLLAAPGKGFTYAGYMCVILKVTRACNLRCSYCHDWRADPRVLSTELEASLWRQLLREAGQSAIDVVWHGGEPTLLPRRRLLASVALQAWWSRPGQVVRNVLQTNGTTMSPQLAALLAHLGFQVSVSLDGPPALHDEARRDAHGRPTSARALRGFRHLRDAGLDPGILMVVNDAVLRHGASEVHDFLQQVGARRVGLIPVRPAAVGDPSTEGSVQDYLPHDEFLAFLLDFEVARRASAAPAIACRELDGLRAALDGRNPGFCELIGGCMGHFLSVDPDGTVAHCDKYVGDDGYVLGSLLRDTLASMLGGAQLASIRDGWRTELDALRSCRHFARCQGWCPHERYAARLAGKTVSADCCGLAPLIDAIDEMEASDA